MQGYIIQTMNLLPTVKTKLNLPTAELAIFLLIIIVSIYFKFFNLEHFYQMGWDQERDANVAWEIIKNANLTLIGPRAVGPDGFFLGPLWYYLLVPFYLLFGMDPIAAPVFGATVGVATTAVAFFATRSVLDTKTALLTSLFWATYPDRTVWNPILIPLFTFILIFSLQKALQGNKKFIIWSCLIFGLALQIHFQAIFFALPLFVTLFALKLQKKFFIKETVCGSLVFMATFLPLVLFDLRNNFINVKSFFNLFTRSEGSVNSVYAFSIYVKNIVNSFPLPFEAHKEIYIAILTLSAAGIIISKLQKQLKIVLLLILFMPPLLFSLYRGNLSEYYFTLCLVPMTLGLSLFITKALVGSFWGKLFTVLVLFILLVQRLEALPGTYQERSLYNKRQAVMVIANQELDPVFNVSYSTPYNEDTGFRYLFKFYGKEPIDIPEAHLWTIVIPKDSENIPPLYSFGDIGVIRR